MGQHRRAVIQPMRCNLHHQPNIFNCDRRATEGKLGESNYELVFLVVRLLVRSLSSSAHAQQGKQPGITQFYSLRSFIIGTFSQPSSFISENPLTAYENNATILEHKSLSNETTEKETETSTMAVSEA
jgi:hypothetical protein